MSTFTYIPDRPATESSSPRLRLTRFGSYEQRTTFGINAFRDSWSLRFGHRSISDASAIDAFLRERDGQESFEWVTPFGETAQFRCSEWSVRLESCDYRSVDARFELQYEPGAINPTGFTALGFGDEYEVSSFPVLTSPGVTPSVLTAGADLCFQVTVADIGANVVIRIEGSLDNVNFFNLAEHNVDFTLTSNGTYGYTLNDCPVQYVRVRLVSLNAGAPSVSAKVGAAPIGHPTVFDWVPDFTADLRYRTNTKVVQFGDGYAQRLKVGLNAQDESWALQFRNRSNAERDSIRIFLRRARGRTAFSWTDPIGGSGKYVCGDWTTTFNNHNNNDIKLTLRKVFES